MLKQVNTVKNTVVAPSKPISGSVNSLRLSPNPKKTIITGIKFLVHHFPPSSNPLMKIEHIIPIRNAIVAEPGENNSKLFRVLFIKKAKIPENNATEIPKFLFDSIKSHSI